MTPNSRVASRPSRPPPTFPYAPRQGDRAEETGAAREALGENHPLRWRGAGAAETPRISQCEAYAGLCEAVVRPPPPPPLTCECTALCCSRLTACPKVLPHISHAKGRVPL